MAKEQNGYSAQEFGEMKAEVKNAVEWLKTVSGKLDKFLEEKWPDQMNRKVDKSTFWKIVGLAMGAFLTLSGWVFAIWREIGKG